MKFYIDTFYHLEYYAIVIKVIPSITNFLPGKLEGTSEQRFLRHHA